MDEFLRRAPLMLVASGKPFQYPQTDWGDAVQMIGPCVLDPGPDTIPDWLASIDRPNRPRHDVVGETGRREPCRRPRWPRWPMSRCMWSPPCRPGNQTELRRRPMRRCAGSSRTAWSWTVQCVAVTHGGMGATQKALARGVPVCVVPYGRDQFEVARRVEVARCGTRLPAKKLSPARLRAKVREAMTMTDGARRVAAGFAATGGAARGADIFEQRRARPQHRLSASAAARAALLVELPGIELGTEIVLTSGNAQSDDGKVRETTRNDLRIHERC